MGEQPNVLVLVKKKPTPVKHAKSMGNHAFPACQKKTHAGFLHEFCKYVEKPW